MKKGIITKWSSELVKFLKSNKTVIEFIFVIVLVCISAYVGINSYLNYNAVDEAIFKKILMEYVSGSKVIYSLFISITSVLIGLFLYSVVVKGVKRVSFFKLDVEFRDKPDKLAEARNNQYFIEAIVSSGVDIINITENGFNLLKITENVMLNYINFINKAEGFRALDVFATESEDYLPEDLKKSYQNIGERDFVIRNRIRGKSNHLILKMESYSTDKDIILCFESVSEFTFEELELETIKVICGLVKMIYREAVLMEELAEAKDYIDCLIKK